MCEPLVSYTDATRELVKAVNRLQEQTCKSSDCLCNSCRAKIRRAIEQAYKDIGVIRRRGP